MVRIIDLYVRARIVRILLLGSSTINPSVPSRRDCSDFFFFSFFFSAAIFLIRERAPRLAAYIRTQDVLYIRAWCAHRRVYTTGVCMYIIICGVHAKIPIHMYVYSAASVLYASDRNRRCSGYLYEKLRSERGEKNKKTRPTPLLLCHEVRRVRGANRVRCKRALQQQYYNCTTREQTKRHLSSSPSRLSAAVDDLIIIITLYP